MEIIIKKICPICNAEYYGKEKQVFCSKKCRGANDRLSRIHENCVVCNKDLYFSKSVHEHNKSGAFCCSKQCRWEYQKTALKGDSNPNYKGANFMARCSCCGKEVKVLDCLAKNSDGSPKKNFYCSQSCKANHQRKILRGKDNPNYRGEGMKKNCEHCGVEVVSRRFFNSTYKRTYCSQKCKSEHQRTLLAGPNNYNYKSDMSDAERGKFRCIDGYAEWRRAVYERDKFTCVCCGDSTGGNLNAHHLDGYNWCKEKRTDVDNGATVCDVCHSVFHSAYGYGGNTKKQFEDFIQKIKIETAI